MTKRASVDVCLPCVDDSECYPNYACVPMFFQGEKREGGYCLKDPDLGTAGCPTNPFSTPTDKRVTLSGASEKVYCGINETTTTCESYQSLIALDSSCEDQDECGAPGLDDALCETVGLNPSRCTYSCELPDECPSGKPCQGPPDNKYCGGPL